ncbi:leucine-rich repeat protein SHOC2, partial [Paragonimus westermani]
MLQSGPGTGGSSTPDSAEFGRAGTPELGDELADLSPMMVSVQLAPHKKSSLVGSSSPFDPKKSKVTVQRPGDQKAYQCGPNTRKNKKTDSDTLKEINRCREEGTTRLDLSKGQLHSLPTSIRDLASHLRELYLYCNKLVSLPSKLIRLERGSECPALIDTTLNREIRASDTLKEINRCREEGTTRLDLSKGQLHSLPTSIRDLASHLRELYLYCNKLVSLPNEIGFLPLLEILMLQENSLSRLPESLSQCNNLHVLDIRHNKLCEIPPVVYSLINLTHLLMRFNRIRIVDEEIRNLTKLQVLSLRENKIRSLPADPGIGELTQLITFDVSHNHLEHLPD